MIVLGVDEVGRGCWAGPLVAGAVILPNQHTITSLRDSKKLSANQRTALDVQIRQQAVAIGLGWVLPAEVDEWGLTRAVQVAMERAVAEAGCKYDELIVDGNINYLVHLPNSRAIIRADDTVQAVSAASIVAKVARDAYMTTVGSQYPDYGFAQHVGYGTARHIEALQKLGVTNEHRRSYKPVQRFLV